MINYRWLYALAFDASIIVAAMFAFEQWPSVVTGLLAIILIGTRQHGIAVLGHDGAHGSICKPRWLNDALAKLCFWPLGISLREYRAFHFMHHGFVGTPHDPERRLKAKNATAWDLPASRRRILMLCAKDFLILPALRDVMPFMALVVSSTSIVWALAFWTWVIVVFGLWPLVLWFMALSTSFWASNRMRIWTEHQGTDGTHCVRMSWWQRFLFAPHNIGWHFEHHANAAVPFHRLPEVRCQKSVTVTELFTSFRGAAE